MHGAVGKAPAIMPTFRVSAGVRKHDHVLTPGRYVGAPPREDDGEPFEDRMKRLVGKLREQQAESVRLDATITANLEKLGFWERES